MFLDQIGELQQNLLAIAGSSLRPRPRFEASARRSYGDVDIRAIALGDFRQYLARGRINRLEGLAGLSLDIFAAEKGARFEMQL